MDSAKKVAVTFCEDFPGQEPELGWLVEAAATLGIQLCGADDPWIDLVRREVDAYRRGWRPGMR